MDNLIETDSSQHHDDPLLLFHPPHCLELRLWLCLLLANDVQFDMLAGSLLDKLQHDAFYQTLMHVKEHFLLLRAQSQTKRFLHHLEQHFFDELSQTSILRKCFDLADNLTFLGL